jgi:outer membrane protein TolC
VAFSRREDALLNIELQTGQKVTETCTLADLSRDVLLPEDFSFDLDEIIVAALNGDPAVQEADRAVGRVEAEQDLTRRQRLPDIDLVGTLSYVHLDNSREDWEYRDSLGISFSVPLYVGGSLNAQTRQAAARAGRVRAERDRLTRQLEQEIRSLARTYLSLQAQVDARRSAVGFKREQVTSMEAAFAEGLQALRELVEAREELAEQQRFFDRALIDLHLTAVKFRRFLE